MKRISVLGNTFALIVRCCAVLCAANTIALSAQTFTTLHSFDGTDGASPFAALIQATGGDLYGTTSAGGTANEGTVFKIGPSGAPTTLQDSCSQQSQGCLDGADPYAGLIQAADGDFYGTTEEGAGGACNNGCGTVFKITPSGTRTTLHSFCAQGGGTRPNAAIQATDGNLYATTVYGGVHHAGRFQNDPQRQSHDAIHLLFSKRLCGRRKPARGAGPGQRWESLRDNRGGRRQLCPLRLRDDLQNHPGWYADHTVQLRFGRLQPHGWARPGVRWGLLRDDICWRGQRQWRDDLQNHSRRYADDALQLLLANRVYRRGGTLGRAGSSHLGVLYGTTDRGGANGDGTVFSLSVGLGH